MSNGICKFCGHTMTFFQGGPMEMAHFWCGFCGSLLMLGPRGVSDYWQRPNVYSMVGVDGPAEARDILGQYNDGMPYHAADRLAQLFHETYEELAPKFVYQTRRESAVPWNEVPQQNKELMIAVCQHVLAVLNTSSSESR